MVDRTYMEVKSERARQVLGVRARLNDKREPDSVEIQWESSEGEVHQLELDWLNALALLSFLKCMQLDSGWPFPNDPRDPTWRAADGRP